MDKQEFLLRLRKELSGLPREDLEERLTFYSEMIDDRMEEGVSEEEAVAAAGSVDEILWQTVEEVPYNPLGSKIDEESTGDPVLSFFFVFRFCKAADAQRVTISGVT